MGDTYPSSKFPAAIDTRGDSLLIAPNASSTFVPAGRLALAVSPTDTTLRVIGINLQLVPTQGVVTVGDELVRYTGVDTTLQELYIANTSLRGYSGTPAVAHNMGTQVMWLLTDAHIQSMHESIIATQRHIGVKGSTDPESIEYRLGSLQQQVADGILTPVTVEITDAMVTAKSFPLPGGAASPSEVSAFVINGASLDNGIDYMVSATTPAVVAWAGLELDGLLTAGDKLLIVYAQSNT